MAILNTGIVAPTGGYQIERSLRFNSADSAYLNRTPASAGNRKTWTWSGWVKRSKISDTNIQTLLSTASNVDLIAFNANDTFRVWTNTNNNNIETTQVFRDVSAWYHIVVAMDTTQATESNRLKIYLNGSQITAVSGTYPTLDYNTSVNNTVQHRIGYTVSGDYNYFSGYLTEVNFIDGQALTPSSFGETDASTGVWKPKAYTGTYGTNGFYLKFADNSGTTSTTLGKDSSGNGNNWTPNGFSVTAGAGNDSLVDTPTSYGTDTGVGGEVRGNYCTLNPLKLGSTGTLSDGNLTWSSSSNQGLSIGTLGFNSGKWYFEFTCGSSVAGTMPGVVKTTVNSAANPNYPGVDANGWGYYATTGSIFNNGSGTAYGATFTTNDVIGVAIDMDAGKIWWSKNGTFQNSGNPSSGTNAGFSNLPTDGTYLSPAIGSGDASTSNGSINFGQRPFAYTAPSGFKAVCTQNLPPVTIGATSTTQANDYFNTVLYPGTGSSQSITGVGFQPDFVWIKERNGAADHGLYDAVRGVQKQLESNNTDAETTETTGLTAFGTDGFTVGALAQLNTNTDTYVAWNWKANGAGSSNTDGSITSTVSANTTAGFSVVSFTTTSATGTATVGHGLGATPSMIIMKNRDRTFNWEIYHISATASGGRLIFTTSAKLTDANPWNQNNQAPTTTIFGYDQAWNGFSGDKIIAYCFAPVAGYSTFGSYTGNGNSDGPFIYTGMRPRWVLIKETGNANSWELLDTARNPYNAADKRLFPNDSLAEATTANTLDIVSNGFKPRVSNTGVNRSGGTYIYAAFAENPFKYSLAR